MPPNIFHVKTKMDDTFPLPAFLETLSSTDR